MGWSKCSLWAREIIASTPALKEAVGWKYKCEKVFNPASCPHCFRMAGKKGFWNCSLTIPTCSTAGKTAATFIRCCSWSSNTECTLWPPKVKFSYGFRISNCFAYDYKDVNQLFIKFYTKTVSLVTKHNNVFPVSLLHWLRSTPLCWFWLG